MFHNKEWIKCSAVAIGFYIAVFVLLAHFFWGFLNPWLIGGCILFAATDVIGLHWWFKRYGNDNDDRFYP